MNTTDPAIRITAQVPEVKRQGGTSTAHQSKIARSKIQLLPGISAKHLYSKICCLLTCPRIGFSTHRASLTSILTQLFWSILPCLWPFKTWNTWQPLLTAGILQLKVALEGYSSAGGRGKQKEANIWVQYEKHCRKSYSKKEPQRAFVLKALPSITVLVYRAPCRAPWSPVPQPGWGDWAAPPTQPLPGAWAEPRNCKGEGFVMHWFASTVLKITQLKYQRLSEKHLSETPLISGFFRNPTHKCVHAARWLIQHLLKICCRIPKFLLSKEHWKKV